MPGLGQESKKTTTRQMPLPSSADGIMDSVRSILAKDGVQSISISMGKPIVYEQSDDSELDPGVDQDLGDLSVYEIARRVKMEEFSPDKELYEGAEPGAVVFWMIYFIEKAGLSPVCILVEEGPSFWLWLGLNRKPRSDRFMGMRIEQDQQVPTGCFMICAAKSRWAPNSEIQFVLKGSYP